MGDCAHKVKHKLTVSFVLPCAVVYWRREMKIMVSQLIAKMVSYGCLFWL